ncbi:hypothetical protein [Deinococcus peraridilitoris]|uniref:Uncharacterized protein n=1 Tax=Deinococcus peraridilitoris (strain DSM 19664 / LMG 22246 / CIP 109416 / KR-200) TaxID=937777 RepID=L0A849_DEIPD|nr:hypothetical protein [Deinococcus peraridilitoris]AFZ69589.1 hypothetical protein Deipe_4230 [Deinococcus peraridilitoris DSM 19664]
MTRYTQIHALTIEQPPETPTPAWPDVTEDSQGDLADANDDVMGLLPLDDLEDATFSPELEQALVAFQDSVGELRASDLSRMDGCILEPYALATARFIAFVALSDVCGMMNPAGAPFLHTSSVRRLPPHQLAFAHASPECQFECWTLQASSSPRADASEPLNACSMGKRARWSMVCNTLRNLALSRNCPYHSHP